MTALDRAAAVLPMLGVFMRADGTFQLLRDDRASGTSPVGWYGHNSAP